jgi:hypothetical protein
MISNKEYNQFKRTYYYPHIIFISGSITNFINSFPNFKNIKISRRSELCDEDFELCGHIQRIRMISCNMSLITNNIFSHLTNLKELKLLDCWDTGSSSSFNNNKIFDYLSNLEKLSINFNYEITDEGIHKLINIKDLYIHECINITGNGLCNLTSLIKLSLYGIKNLFDHHFKKLVNLEVLTLTFIDDVTSECITCLPKIKKISFVECKGITSCNNFDKLKNLSIISFYQCPIKDSDFIYLKNIKELYIIYCPLIQGLGIKYLLNIEILSIYENLIEDSSFDDIILLNKIKKLLSQSEFKNIKVHHYKNSYSLAYLLHLIPINRNIKIKILNSKFGEWLRSVRITVPLGNMWAAGYK